MGANGEDARQLVQFGPGERVIEIQWSPDSRRVAFLHSKADAKTFTVSILARPIDGDESSVLVSDPGLGSFFWSDDGRLLYSRAEPGSRGAEANLWALEVDIASARPRGTPRKITDWAGFSFADISVTADGKRLVFVRQMSQSDVYLGDFAAGKLSEPQRFTFDNRQDIPSAWTADGTQLIFHSDRNGTWDVLRQAAGSRASDNLALGPAEQRDAALGPDGATLLYWEHAAVTGGVPQNMRLIAMPFAGGSIQTVLEAGWAAQFRCYRGMCLLGEPDIAALRLKFSTFDLTGKRDQVADIAFHPSGTPVWDLSPDGVTVALADSDEQKNRVRFFNLQSGEERHSEPAPARISGVAWTRDGNLLATTTHVQGSVLLRIAKSGEVQTLWSAKQALARPLPSPDQKRVAFALYTLDSNAWMLEHF
jgi:Tol biopolymer transport system component